MNFIVDFVLRNYILFRFLFVIFCELILGYYLFLKVLMYYKGFVLSLDILFMLGVICFLYLF